MRESKVETYLHDEVTKAGGTTRKFSSRTRPNNPDRIVVWPVDELLRPVQADVHFVECKAPGKDARAGQAREHTRLRLMGCRVLVIDTHKKVDKYVKGNR